MSWNSPDLKSYCPFILIINYCFSLALPRLKFNILSYYGCCANLDGTTFRTFYTDVVTECCLHTSDSSDLCVLGKAQSCSEFAEFALFVYANEHWANMYLRKCAVCSSFETVLAYTWQGITLDYKCRNVFANEFIVTIIVRAARVTSAHFQSRRNNQILFSTLLWEPKQTQHQLLRLLEFQKRTKFFYYMTYFRPSWFVIFSTLECSENECRTNQNGKSYAFNLSALSFKRNL